MKTGKKSAAYLPSIKEQVLNRWSHACMADFHPLRLHDAGRFQEDRYAMVSIAVLDALFYDGMVERTGLAKGKTASALGRGPALIRGRTVPDRTANPNPEGKPWHVIMAELKMRASHWESEFTPRNPDALEAVVEHLLKADIPHLLANFLGEDLVRQHSFNCGLPKSFTWSNFRAELQRVASAAESGRALVLKALEGCSVQALSSLAEEWRGHPAELSLNVLATSDQGQEIAVRKDALRWFETLQITAEAVLEQCPKNHGGSTTVLGDSHGGTARRWLVLNTQALLRRLGLPAGNSKMGPLAKVVALVDLASGRLLKASETQDITADPPAWANRFVDEMRISKVRP